MHCRKILFTPVVLQGPDSFWGLVSFFVRRTVAELRGLKVAQFSDFGLFSPHKTLKTYIAISLQPRGYIAEWFRFFHVIVEGPIKRVPSGTGHFLRLLESWGPPNLPKFSPMANGHIHTECNCTARQIWTKDVWKRAIIRTYHHHFRLLKADKTQLIQ